MFAVVLSAAVAASPAPAPAAGPIRIPEATYVRTVDANGIVRLSGRYRETGEPFRFRVYKDGTVRGWVGTEPVRFRASSAGLD